MTNGTASEGTKRNKIRFGFVIAAAILMLLGIIIITFAASDNKSLMSSLSYAEKTGVTIPADEYNPLYDNNIVCVSGEITYSEPISDSITGFSATGLCLRRISEIYQWMETEQSDEYGTEYTYRETWVSEPIDSERFRNRSSHVNTPDKFIPSDEFYDYDDRLGAFSLPIEAVNDLANKEAKLIQLADTGYKADLERYFVCDNYITSFSREPSVDDIRISYTVLAPTHVTIVALQHGDTFTSFSSDSGSDVILMYDGIYTLEEAVAIAADNGRIKAAVGCVIGAALIIAGILILNFLANVPIFGGLSKRSSVDPNYPEDEELPVVK